MKGLVLTIGLISGLIAIGFGTSVLITNNLSHRVSVAEVHGLEDGRSQGYANGRCEGEEEGYQDGSRTGYAVALQETSPEPGEGFYFSYNPTYNEVREFLNKTDQTTAMGINNCAEASGIRTAYVRCQIARQSEHRTVYVYNIIAFETIDEGLIFIRPRSHEEIRVEVGQSYSRLNGFTPPLYDDTVTKITFFW